MKDCIFCKIASHEIPSEIVYEDDDYIAFLDINPKVRGMTVVIPKKHHDSNIYQNTDSVISRLMRATKKTALKLQKSLNAERVLTAIEGFEISHLHIKLFPFYESSSVFDTMTGRNYPKPSPSELHAIAEEINNG